jgi:hypothetical protein
MTILEHIKFWMVMLFFGLLLGVGGAWGIQQWLHMRANAHLAMDSAKTTGKNIINARKGSDRIDAAVTRGNQKAASVRNAAAEHLAAEAAAREEARAYAAAHPDEQPEVPTDAQNATVDPAAQLDDDTVRLLNAARAGDAAGAAASGHAEGPAPATADAAR